MSFATFEISSRQKRLVEIVDCANSAADLTYREFNTFIFALLHGQKQHDIASFEPNTTSTMSFTRSITTIRSLVSSIVADRNQYRSKTPHRPPPNTINIADFSHLLLREITDWISSDGIAHLSTTNRKLFTSAINTVWTLSLSLCAEN